MAALADRAPLRGLVLTLGGARKRTFDDQALVMAGEIEIEYIRGVNGRNVGQKASRWKEELQPLFDALRSFKAEKAREEQRGCDDPCNRFAVDWDLSDDDYEAKFLAFACLLKNEERPVLGCLCSHLIAMHRQVEQGFNFIAEDNARFVAPSSVAASRIRAGLECMRRGDVDLVFHGYCGPMDVVVETFSGREITKARATSETLAYPVKSNSNTGRIQTSLWGAVAYSCSKRGVDTFFRRLRSDLGTIFMSRRGGKYIDVKPIDRCLPKELIQLRALVTQGNGRGQRKGHGTERVQGVAMEEVEGKGRGRENGKAKGQEKGERQQQHGTWTRSTEEFRDAANACCRILFPAAAVRAPMLRSRIHEKFDAAFANSTTTLLALGEGLELVEVETVRASVALAASQETASTAAVSKEEGHASDLRICVMCGKTFARGNNCCELDKEGVAKLNKNRARYRREKKRRAREDRLKKQELATSKLTPAPPLTSDKMLAAWARVWLAHEERAAVEEAAASGAFTPRPEPPKRPRTRKLCSQWKAGGTCTFGDNCKYRHGWGVEATDA